MSYWEEYLMGFIVLCRQSIEKQKAWNRNIH